MSSNLILVADDNEDNVEMLSRWLRRQGYPVITATNGEEAVTATQASRPNIVLMDLSMPVMSGLEATRVIRADPELGNTPVIALTAHAMASDKAECHAAGCNEVLTKPVDFEALKKCLQTYIGYTEVSGQLKAH